jgi:NADPH:quinone reductase-like Zn-dependent oxidoreductase
VGLQLASPNRKGLNVHNTRVGLAPAGSTSATPAPGSSDPDHARPHNRTTVLRRRLARRDRIHGHDRPAEPDTLRAVIVSPFVGQRLRSFLSKPRGADLVVLKELLEAGKVTPVIDRTFALAETPDAIRYVGERSTQGKTVITV